MISSTKPGAMGIKYDYFNGCNLVIDKYGHNNRNYTIWKAE